jgi:tetratricopeptide (TPR) repeat protein
VKSVAIDDTLAEGHTSLAAFKEYFDLDWPGAKSEFQRAIQLNPNYALAHDWYSDYLMNVGQAKEAAAEATIYKELDPLSPGSYAWMGQIFYFTRDYDRAIEQFQRALDLDPNFAEAHCRLGDAYTQKGLYKQARAELEAALALSGRSPRFLAALGRSHAISGKRSEAARVLNELKELKSRQFVPSYSIALIYAGLGDRDRTLEWLRKACEEHPGDIVFLNVDPALDSLHSDPRFQDLVRRIGLTP